MTLTDILLFIASGPLFVIIMLAIIKCSESKRIKKFWDWVLK